MRSNNCVTILSGVRCIRFEPTKCLLKSSSSAVSNNRSEDIISELLNYSNVSYLSSNLPLKVCFDMTINKSRGQSLIMAGIGLREECFSHGHSMSHVLELALPVVWLFQPKKEIKKKKKKTIIIKTKG
ncbi:ATP-dependent DNA helicase PIF1-like [Aphis craccivora]|uniref:ATP-dependent DNA helicase PIF1-like n=1 Tax=Aphis craccivora TaxID=307492 RepID=A0A6G0XZP8_APHCR|nr:ATP-dependent DNA helicase PIF1-like [Aphis craccivora]